MTSILTIIQQQDDEYDRLHALYEEAKQRVDSATTPEELEAATTVFHPIQQEFLANREQAVPTEVYQIIASYLDRESRARLAECDKHLHYQGIYGKYSGRFVWSEGGLLEQVYRRTYKEWPREISMTPLLHASREGTSRAVRVLIDAKANLEAVETIDRRTPLRLACLEGHEEVAGLLMDAGANVNAQDRYGRSPLDSAAGTNRVTIVRRLLAAGANPNHGFDLAVNRNHLEATSLLIEAKAGVNFNDLYSANALHHAVVKNSAKIVPVLIAAGTVVNSSDCGGRTPLAQACNYSRTDITMTLLAAKADPNIVDFSGWSPIMFACERDSADIVRQLLAAKAYVHLKDRSGWTALSIVRKKKQNNTIVDLLLAAGAVEE